MDMNYESITMCSVYWCDPKLVKSERWMLIFKCDGNRFFQAKKVHS